MCPYNESMKNNQKTTTKGLKSEQTYLFLFLYAR